MVDGEMIVLNDELDIGELCALIYTDEMVYKQSFLLRLTMNRRHSD